MLDLSRLSERTHLAGEGSERLPRASLIPTMGGALPSGEPSPVSGCAAVSRRRSRHSVRTTRRVASSIRTAPPSSDSTMRSRPREGRPGRSRCRNPTAGSRPVAKAADVVSCRRTAYKNDRSAPPAIHKLAEDEAAGSGSRVVRGKDRFVLTTNVDALLVRNGFDPERVWSIQGDYAFLQCLRPCTREVWPSAPFLQRALAAIDPVTQEVADPACCTMRIFRVSPAAGGCPWPPARGRRAPRSRWPSRTPPSVGYATRRGAIFAIFSNTRSSLSRTPPVSIAH